MLFRRFSASTTSRIASPNSLKAFLLSSTNFFFASKLLPSLFHFIDNSSTLAIGVAALSATDLLNSAISFLASLFASTSNQTPPTTVRIAVANKTYGLALATIFKAFCAATSDHVNAILVVFAFVSNAIEAIRAFACIDSAARINMPVFFTVL